MCFGAFVGDAAHQHNGLGYDQFSNTARIRVGRIENDYAMFGGGLNVHLIGADTEAADTDEFFGGREDLGVELAA